VSAEFETNRAAAAVCGGQTHLTPAAAPILVLRRWKCRRKMILVIAKPVIIKIVRD